MTYDAFRISDLDTIWEAQAEFWGGLRDNDAPRRTDSGWSIAEIPAHLARYHEFVAAAITGGCDPDFPVLRTHAELDQWDHRDGIELATNSPSEITTDALMHNQGHSPMQRFYNSQSMLREAADDLTVPVHLPWLAARGCRPLVFALEYLFYHDWVHFAEAHLLIQGWLPGAPDRITHNALNLHMQVLACALGAWPKAVAPPIWQLNIEGLAGGQWRFTKGAVRWQVERVNEAHGPSESTPVYVYQTVETFVRSQWLGQRGFSKFFLRQSDPVRRWAQPPAQAQWPAIPDQTADLNGL